MITELLGLAGSGALGSIVGMVADMLQSRREQKLREVELDLARRAREDGQTIDFLQAGSGFSASPYFGLAFIAVVLCYCLCCAACVYWPDVPLQTFNPDEEPKTIRFFWGLLEWQRSSTKVWSITTGGVGYALLHPLAFTITAVLTGINPMRKR